MRIIDININEQSKALIEAAYKREQDYYIQEFVGYPFVSAVARSGISMEKELGFRYTDLIYRFANGVGEMGYRKKDFSDIYAQIAEKLNSDGFYLENIENKYMNTFERYSDLFEKIRKGLRDLTDDELLAVLKNIFTALGDSVGTAHILESIGQCIEEDFRVALAACGVGADKMENAVKVLSSPVRMSWIEQEENELMVIAKMGKTQQRVAIAEHAKKWYWVKTSYASRGNPTEEYFYARLSEVFEKETPSFEAVSEDKKTVIQKLNLTERAKKLITLIEKIAEWQDRRKGNVYKTVDNAFLLFAFLEEKFGAEKNIFSHLVSSDIEKIHTVNDCHALIPELVGRKAGMYILQNEVGEYIIFGSDVPTVDILRRKQKSNLSEVREIKGSTAFKGKIIGKVKVCRTMSDISAFPDGDILVTSMTRPEFVPAVKKSIGVITDEGGITCHAAIVARELKKPCIIGTKIATQVLHDGDLVEVDADNGVVRVLEKA